jgi:hypothetical protein
MGEERLEALLHESLAVATRTGALKPSNLNRVNALVSVVGLRSGGVDLVVEWKRSAGDRHE